MQTLVFTFSLPNHHMRLPIFVIKLVEFISINMILLHMLPDLLCKTISARIYPPPLRDESEQHPPSISITHGRPWHAENNQTGQYADHFWWSFSWSVYLYTDIQCLPFQLVAQIGFFFKGFLYNATWKFILSKGPRIIIKSCLPLILILYHIHNIHHIFDKKSWVHPESCATPNKTVRNTRSTLWSGHVNTLPLLPNQNPGESLNTSPTLYKHTQQGCQLIGYYRLFPLNLELYIQ